MGVSRPWTAQWKAIIQPRTTYQRCLRTGEQYIAANGMWKKDSTYNHTEHWPTYHCWSNVCDYINKDINGKKKQSGAGCQQHTKLWASTQRGSYALLFHFRNFRAVMTTLQKLISDRISFSVITWKITDKLKTDKGRLEETTKWRTHGCSSSACQYLS